MKKLALILIFLALAAPALAQEETTTEEITTPEEGTPSDEGVIPDEPEPPITTDVTGEEPIIGTEVSPQEETIPGPQMETLFDQELLDFGGFGGAVLKVTRLKDEWTLLLGGRGALLMNHSISLGGGGWVSVKTLNQNLTEGEKSSPDLLFMYGGPILEYIFLSHKLVHFSVHTLVGYGALVEYPYHDYYRRYYDRLVDGFFVAEPGAEVEINVLEFFRISLGASYRYVNGVELENFVDSDLSSVGTFASFKFGYF